MSPSRPLVTVVVPVHDGAATLEAALASVLAQSVREIEIVVVDDDSNDGSGAIARDLSRRSGDRRLRLVRRDRTGGVSSSRNLGVRHGSAPYLAFLDADDLWTPDKLSAQLEALAARPGTVGAYCWTDYIDGAGRPIGHGDRVDHEGDVYLRLLSRNFLESGSNLLVERRAFEAVGGFDPAFSGAADWDLSLRLAREHRFACAPGVGVLYRVSTGGMSSQTRVQEAECVALLQRELEGDPSRRRRAVRRARAHLDHYLAFKALEDPHPPSGVRKARRYFVRGLARDPSIGVRRPRLTGHLFVQLMAATLQKAKKPRPPAKS